MLWIYNLCNYNPKNIRRRQTNLDSWLRNVNVGRQLFPHYYIRVMRLRESVFQYLQLLVRERSARASMLPSGWSIMHLQYYICEAEKNVGVLNWKASRFCPKQLCEKYRKIPVISFCSKGFLVGEGRGLLLEGILLVLGRDFASENF